MIAKYTSVLVGLLVFAGCATAEQDAARIAANEQRLAEAKAETGDEKVSLSKSLDEYGEMTLLDDDTGETKLICKYEKVTGSRFGKKICATPEEWENRRKGSREELAKTQRNMDARCPNGGLC